MTGRAQITRTLVAAGLSAGLVGGLAAQPAAAHVPDNATTAMKTVTRTPSTPPIVVNARTGRHAGFDRFVIDLRGKATGYRVRYVSAPHYDASGKRIPISGKAYLMVVLTPANAHTSAGKSTYTGPRRSFVELPTIRSFAFAGDFEGHVSFALALRKKASLHVGELRNPRRLYIDIAH